MVSHKQQPPKRRLLRRLRRYGSYALIGLGLLAMVVGFFAAMPVGVPAWLSWLFDPIRRADAGITVMVIGLVVFMVAGLFSMNHAAEIGFRHVETPPLKPTGNEPWALKPQAGPSAAPAAEKSEVAEASQ
jgi:hypothetical protein